MRTFRKGELTVQIYDARAEMGTAAAEACVSAIRAALETRDEINMIFAAAPSQNEFLAGLARASREGRADFARVNAFHMDEYVGLPDSAPQRFAAFLKDELFDCVPMKSVNLIDSATADAQAECVRYSALLAAHPCDILCMGVGENGHIAFNDPHVANFRDAKAVKVVELDEVCRMQQVHDGCFASLADVPTHAMTLTIPTLFAASAAFCVVPAQSKARAVRAMLEGPISEACPASILRDHPNAALFLDADSASLL